MSDQAYQDAPYATPDRTDLVGQRWFVNLRTSEGINPRLFSDSVLVIGTTTTHITVKTHVNAIAIIPWSAVAFLASDGGLGIDHRSG